MTDVMLDTGRRMKINAVLSTPEREQPQVVWMRSFLERLGEPESRGKNGSHAEPIEPWEKEEKVKAYVSWVGEKRDGFTYFAPDDLSEAHTVSTHGERWVVRHRATGLTAIGKDEVEARGELGNLVNGHLGELRKFWKKVPKPLDTFKSMAHRIIEARYEQFGRAALSAAGKL